MPKCLAAKIACAKCLQMGLWTEYVAPYYLPYVRPQNNQSCPPYWDHGVTHNHMYSVIVISFAYAVPFAVINIVVVFAVV